MLNKQQSLFRVITSLVIAIYVSGCAGPLYVWKNQPPPYSSVHPNQQLTGSVGVVAAQFESQMDFQALLDNHQTAVVSGGIQGAVVGTAVGTGVAFVVLISSLGACLNPAAAATCPSFGAIIAGGTVAGGAVGAAVGKNAENKNKEAAQAAGVKDVSYTISKVLQTQNFQQSIQNHIIQYGGTTTKLSFNAVASIGPASADDLPDYSKSNVNGVANILEVKVLDATLRRDGRFFDSPYGSLIVSAKARLIRAADGKVLYESNYRHVSAPMYHLMLAADDAVRFDMALQLAYRDLAEQIVDQIFLVYEPTHERKITGNYCLQSPLLPLNPKPPKGSMCMWHCDRGTTLVSSSKIPTIDTLEPQMTWESFPTADEQKDDKNHELAGVGNVSYEVKLYRAVPAFPESSYRNTSLVPGQLLASTSTQEPSFMPGKPLETCGNYFWTFRARFDMNGQPRATEWAGVHDRELESCWDMGAKPPGPSRAYYPFKTYCPANNQKAGAVQLAPLAEPLISNPSEATASNQPVSQAKPPVSNAPDTSAVTGAESTKDASLSKAETAHYLEGSFLSKQMDTNGLAGFVRGISVKFLLTNMADKEITSLSGKVNLLDDSGKQIGSISIHSDKRIPSHGSIEHSQTVYPIIFGGYGKLKDLDQEKIKAEFSFDTIEFSDGTKFKK